MKSNKKMNNKKALKKELERILNSNKESVNQENYNPFAARVLFSLINEQENDETPVPSAQETKSPDDFTPENNKKDFENSLEKTTDPSSFDVEGVSPNLTADVIKSIREWSIKLDEFAEFLNDPAQTTSEGKPSLHKILSDGDRSGSLLRGVTRKASDSITRIAGEVEKLKEILNTYIITAPKKLRDTEGQNPGWTQF
jgi:hypothetical protein